MSPGFSLILLQSFYGSSFLSARSRGCPLFRIGTRGFTGPATTGVQACGLWTCTETEAGAEIVEEELVGVEEVATAAETAAAEAKSETESVAAPTAVSEGGGGGGGGVSMADQFPSFVCFSMREDAHD